MAGWRKKNGRSGGTSLQKKLLLKYLREYKERALAFYHSGSRRRNLDSHSDLNLNLDSDQPPTKPYSNQPITVDGVELPLLDDKNNNNNNNNERDDNDDCDALIEQPYLALPKELTGHHRSLVHDICTDTLQLFHCGVDGANEGERFVVVSIYSDGLEYVPGLGDDTHTPRPAPIPLRMGTCRPWIARQSVDSRSETTERKKAAIWRMIDQPGRCCLRDAHDTIDLVEMQGDTLGTIEPPRATDTTCTIVTTAEEMRHCIRELEENTPTEIGFDIECYNKGKSLQITCLIQLATNDGREYVIDVLGGGDGGGGYGGSDGSKDAGVWDEVHGLARFFEDPTIVKIGHGIRSLDVQSLQRDFGLFVVNAFDTYEAATVLRLPEMGLAKICAHYGLKNSELYKDLKAQHQASDWMHRPLTSDKILYGRYDVHYLVRLRRLMMRDLIRLDNSPTIGIGIGIGIGIDPAENNKHVFSAVDLRMDLSLMRVISKSQENCLKLWNTAPESPMTNKQFLALAKQHKKDGRDLTKSQLALYAKLASWRESVARNEEKLPGVLCPLEYLARVAILRPATEGALKQIRWDLPQFLTSSGPHHRQHMAAMLGLVRESLAEDGVAQTEFPTYKALLSGSESTKRNGNGNGNGYGYDTDVLRSIFFGPLFWTVTGATIVSAMLFVDRRRKGYK
eukprot:CAMPEP_0172387508 /NCGR_PEP_ID=MMETSP1061-20121228/4802_1 /TAXON_ID=37318 /ORGANISM="Pseudo-nitzschia pungens, Strain cf. pungens" /LENGTH=678 /DNA_ID=CAMNT_0013117159 /DNA_START=236 /DNA_END=2272 /DNA_ORIENTATION=+